MRLTSSPLDLPLRYNIAPTQRAPVVRYRDGARTLDLLRWGLVPSWAKDLAVGSSMINARGETLTGKPAFRTAIRSRRCLIPASGFYEWDKLSGGGTKQPYYVTGSDEAPIAFGGMWESWTSPEHETVETFTIVTTAPNEMMARIHDRMPLILDPNDYDAWLDPTREDVSALVRPFPAELMLARPVSTRVNCPRNDDPSLLATVAIPRAEGLFG